MTGLHVSALSKVFPPHDVALRSVNFALAAGQIGVIVGPNGAGKSTLLRCCSGCVQPSSGTIRRPSVGVAYLGDADYLYADATVGENLTLVAALTHRTTEIAAIADEWGVRAWWTRRCATLSFGQRRRVALARSWLVGHTFLCLDEPLRGLDTDAMQIFYHAAQHFVARGGTMLLAAQSDEHFTPLRTTTWHLCNGQLQPQERAA